MLTTHITDLTSTWNLTQRVLVTHILAKRRSECIRRCVPVALPVPFWSLFFSFLLLYGTVASAQPIPSGTPLTDLLAHDNDSLARGDSVHLPRYPAIQEKNGEFVVRFRAFYPDSIKLPNEFLFKGSLRVYVDQVILDTLFYTVDLRKGIIGFFPLFRDQREHDIEVRYRAIPIPLRGEVFKKEYITQQIVPSSVRDSVRRSDTVEVRGVKRTGIDDLFGGSSLRKSGSIVRGFNVGSNQDLNITSGLRLQLDGEIADGVTISAALTDENTPIQPEGNTQTLSEFDRVYVEIGSKHAKAVLGDFTTESIGTEFANLSRRLQGAEVSAMTDFGGDAFRLEGGAAFAVSRGRFAFNQFNGLDGVQGPYRLRGLNNEPFIVVLAGTERIYVDGELQVRGQNNDYVIEYGTGEITFQPRRLITQQSRITADFQYTERLYPRSFLATKAKAQLWDSVLSIQASWFSESDDASSPIDFILTDEARRILSEAGGNRLAASDTSGFFIGADENGQGRGSYERRDTVVNGAAVSIFRFLGQGAARAVWAPAFSFVGEGEGDYRRLSIGVFEYAGPGFGSYVASRLLPIPTAQNLIDLAVTLRPMRGLSVFLEGAFSQNDLNSLSPLEDSLRGGNAYNIGVQLSPQPIRLMGAELGEIGFRIAERQTSRSFAFIDRILPVDLNREFNLIDFDGRTLFDAMSSERIRTVATQFSPRLPRLHRLTGEYSFGSLDRDTLFFAQRHDLTLTYVGDSLAELRLGGNYMTSDNTIRQETATWTRQSLRSRISFAQWQRAVIPFFLEPFFNVELSQKDTRDRGSDTLRQDSHRITDATIGLRIPSFYKQSLSVSYGWRHDELVASEGGGGVPLLLPASFARTISADWRYLPDGLFLAQLTLTSRLRAFTEPFRVQGNADNETFLVRLQTRLTPWRGALEAEFLYDVGTEKTATLERQFFPVPRGFGNFIWIDRNGNGLREFDEFVPFRLGDLGSDSLQYVLRTFPSDELFPTVDLRSSVRLRLRPSRLFERASGWLETAVGALSSETLIRIEERSTERDLSRIYFFDFSRFQNDSTTLFGAWTLQEDLFLFETEITNVRFRLQERRSLSQFSLGVERRRFQERSIRFVTRVGYELGIDVTGSWQANATLAGQGPVERQFIGAQSREFDITVLGLLPEVSYRPIQDLEFALRLTNEYRQNRLPEERGESPEIVFFNAQQLRASYAFRGKGRLSVQVERTESRFINTNEFTAVFELTGGFLSGTTFLWRVDADYRISSFITATLGYDGRSLPDGRIIHTGRAEVRAVF